MYISILCMVSPSIFSESTSAYLRAGRYYWIRQKLFKYRRPHRFCLTRIKDPKSPEALYPWLTRWSYRFDFCQLLLPFSSLNVMFLLTLISFLFLLRGCTRYVDSRQLLAAHFSSCLRGAAPGRHLRVVLSKITLGEWQLTDQ